MCVREGFQRGFEIVWKLDGQRHGRGSLLALIVAIRALRSTETLPSQLPLGAAVKGVYGNEKLVRGSGLFVGETGVEASHHFLTPRDENAFRLTEGRYTLDVFARLLGDSSNIRLFSQSLEISREIAAALQIRPRVTDMLQEAKEGTELHRHGWNREICGRLPSVLPME